MRGKSGKTLVKKERSGGTVDLALKLQTTK